MRTDWRAILRRSMRRSAELIGGTLLFAVMVFLALALVSYTQTDPSGSTASGSPVENWMGLGGAWFAERVLMVFGLPGALILPLLLILARRLWDGTGDLIEETEDDADMPVAVAWWRLALMLTLATILIDAALALTLTRPGGTLPAGTGGMAGLIGAGGVHWLAHFAGTVAGWVSLGLALVIGAVGIVLGGRVFLLEGWRFNPFAYLPRRRVYDHDDDDVVGEAEAPTRATRSKGSDATFAPAFDDTRKADAPSEPARRTTEITDPSRSPAPAPLQKAKQGDLFDKYELPGIDLLEETPVSTAPKIDKLALERNARLLENVLDDFNVKGEIMAVRTGPVVTMYELEPAPESRRAA